MKKIIFWIIALSFIFGAMARAADVNATLTISKTSGKVGETTSITTTLTNTLQNSVEVVKVDATYFLGAYTTQQTSTAQANIDITRPVTLDKFKINLGTSLEYVPSTLKLNTTVLTPTITNNVLEASLGAFTLAAQASATITFDAKFK